MPFPSPVRPDRNAFDAAGPEGPAAVQQASLDERSLADELVPVPDQCVHPAERVVPVLVGRPGAEDVVEQGPAGG